MTIDRTTEVAGVTVHTDHFIGGNWIGNDQYFGVHSPLCWDDGPIAEVSRGDEIAADMAIRYAVDGFAVWSK